MASSASHSYPPKDHQTSSGTGATTTATANGGPSALSSSDSRRFRVQGWDPILIVAQIVVIQTIHYLTLALVVPPLLSIFSDPLALEYEGGSANIAMIMDWREMAGWGTLARHGKLEAGGWAGHGVLPEGLGRRPLRLSDAANRQDAGGAKGLLAKVEDGLGEEWGDFVRSTSAFDIAADPRRGWVLAVAWAIASLVGVFSLYHLVRRPTHILDHSLTLVLNHFVLTTYYAAAFPTSIFFYFVISISAAVQVVWTENLCVKREMRDGLGLGWKLPQ